MPAWSRFPRLIANIAASRGEQRRFVVLGWLLAPAVELSLAVAGLERTLGWLEASSPHPPEPRTAHPVTPADGQRLVAGLYRLHLVRGACLPRSLVQYWLHRREGTPVRFVVGVRRPDEASTTPSLDAHAWVEAIQPSRAEQPSDGCASQEPKAFEPLLVREATPARARTQEAP